jgi:UDP-N-acetylglucosamine 2-epimerase (non-hydrolysing)
VDAPDRLARILGALARAGQDHGLPVLVSVHPRTADRIARFRIPAEGLRLLRPFGFFDFVKLEQRARAVLSDSGTVQEECAIFGVPNVTLRDVTERPETLECGSNVLSGSAPDDIAGALSLALGLPATWSPPPEYMVPHVSRTVAKIVLGFTSIRRHSAGADMPGPRQP